MLVLCAICESQSGETSNASTKTAEQVYKNIQVLKGVPADQLIPGMQFITASLGVQCDFCHLENAFEKDDKQAKQTARKMMRMMFTVNKDSFDGHKEVTCYACHRGVGKPVPTPIIAAEPAPPAPSEGANHKETTATALPEARKIVDQYLLATGSSATFPGASTCLQKGTLRVGAAKCPVEMLSKGTINRLTTVHFPGGDSITGFNPQVRWVSTPGRDLHKMSAAELDAARLETYQLFVVDPGKIFKDLHVERQEEVGGHLAYVVSAERSGLLSRLTRYLDTPFGLNPTQIDYEDYREEAVSSFHSVGPSSVLARASQFRSIRRNAIFRPATRNSTSRP